ncbi:MAG: flagellar biosynthesis protein [Cypionkella sp.]|nr:flagellar biosynthesis protein [Cypionkella sp.]
MRALNLEVFEAPLEQGQTPVVVLESIAFEEAKLMAYDQGYRAGWDDAAAAQQNDQTQISAELARHLKSLSFTFADARQHVLGAMEPLLQDIVARLLPAIARASLAPTIVQHLRPLSDRASDCPVEIMINGAVRPAVEAMMAQTNGPPHHLIDEPSLGEGQAVLKLGQSETRIDLDGAIAEIALAVTQFFQLPERTQND